MSLVPVIPRRPLIWPASVEAIRAVIPPDEEVYLVGGAVRDAYLHRPLHDIDLALPGDGCSLARHIGNSLDGKYYPLDEERGVGRALIPWEGIKLTVDAAQFRGPDLITDLRKRDFTLNAMAVRLTGDLQAVFDPLGGLDDLDARRLRECNPDSIASDPVRALRAVRASMVFGLRIDPVTRQNLRTYASQLADVSPERIRDEFFQILGGNQPSGALDVLHRLGLLERIAPEVVAMPTIEQGPPHQFNVWRHTLMTVERLDTILRIFAPQHDDNLTANVQIGMIAVTLNDFRQQLQDHLAQKWPGRRPHRALLLLAALLHDAGKASTRSVDPDGRVRFLEHERVGARLAGQRAAALRLSKDEMTRLETIVRHHMRPHWLSAGQLLTARTIYHFWHDIGPAGVDVCLLALADYLATHGVMLDQHAWLAYLGTQQTLLERYFLHYETAIAPPPLIKGKDLLRRFKLEPGPFIGQLLGQVGEAQVAGEISTRKEALDWVQRFLDTQT